MWCVLTRSGDGLSTIVRLASDPTRQKTAFGEAILALARTRLAILRDEPLPTFDDAEGALRGLDDPYWIASALIDHAEWLVDRCQVEEAVPLATEAREIFERLRAKPKLERVERLEAAYVTSSTSAPTSA